jgi:hypothetical protein
MRITILYLLAVIFSFVSGAWVMISANPEVSFWLDVANKRDRELKRWRAQDPGKPCIIFAGGSSCAFSVRPDIIQASTGLKTFNYGAAAGSGSKFLIDQALQRCRKDDFLVIALEPHFLVQDCRNKPTQLGISLAVAKGSPNLAVGGATFDSQVSPIEFCNFLRPGARYSATWTAKALRGDMSYRYSADNYREGGWLETDYSKGTIVSGGLLPPQRLTKAGEEILKTATLSARSRGIKVAYSLPWLLSDPHHENANRENNRNLIHQVMQILPVLDDPAMGVASLPNLYSDTEYHLNAVGAKKRSEILASALSTAIVKH